MLKVELSAYDPGWVASFRRIDGLIRGALGSKALIVEHVGSTSVPGLCAKPIVDVVLAVDDSADEVTYVGALEGVGFVLHLREPEWHEHRLLRLVDPAANVHVFSSSCPEVDRMLRFRDVLRADEEARALYEARKRQLAEQEWARVQDYADSKSEVVEALLRRSAGS